MKRLACLLLLASALFAGPRPLAAQPGAPQAVRAPVRDSVKMTRQVYSWYNTDSNGYSCGAYVYATWPDVLLDHGLPGGYGRYSRVAVGGTPAHYVPYGYGQATNDPSRNLIVPPGYLAHSPQLGGHGFGPGAGDNCSSFVAQAQGSVPNGAMRVLNAAPFQITDWYAVFTIPDGTPIALFEWEQARGLDIAFDASFESERSREVDATQPSKKRPVASYAWDFGDGQTGSGARPTHVYVDTGRFIVTLTVTDDDGETARRTETVEVKGGVLSVRVEVEEPREVHVGDTLTFVATVTNTGREAVTAVAADRVFTHHESYPSAAGVPGDRFQDPAFTRVGETEKVTFATLAAGDQIEVRGQYRVETVGKYRPTGTTVYEPIEAEIRSALTTLTARTLSGEPAAVVDACEAAACNDRWTVKPRVYTFELTFKAAPPTGLAAQEVSAVPSGLTAGPSGALSVVARHRIRTADLSERVCRSGCVDVEVVVKDEQGQPAANVEVAVSAPAVAITQGFGAVTSGQKGRFCDPDPAGSGTRCGTTLRTFSDAEGRVRSVYLAPGVVSDVPVTITAKPYDTNISGKAERTLTVQPNVVREATISVNDETSRALMAALAVRGFSDNAQKLAELPATFCKAVGTTLGTAGGAAVRPTVDLSFLGDLPADALEWGCGKLPSAPFPTVLTLGKPFGELVPLVWMLESTQLPGIGLAKIDKKFAPPFVQVRDDFTPFVSDALVALARANPAASHLSPLDLLRGQNVEVKITEVSTLADLTTDLAQTEKSTYGLYVTIGDQTRLVAAGYDARLWLQEASLLTQRPQTSAAASAGDTEITATAPSPRAEETAEATSATGTEAAAGALAAGDFVTLGAGLPTAEVVQVRTVEGTTVRLTTPLRHGHAAGETLYVVARRAVGLPERPLPFAPYDSAAATARPLLRWTTMAPATNADVQIGRDTLFTTLVQEHAAVRADSLRLGGLAEGQTYAWRVRARSELGVGPWSRPRTFVATTPVASEDAAGAAGASAVALGAPSPNPSRGAASVAFALPTTGAVRLSVYDLLGREVAVLVDETRAAGRHVAAVPAATLSPGLYVVRLVAGAERRTQRLVVVR